MRTKDLKTGVPYVYDTGRRYRSFASQGVMFVLTTEVHKTVGRPLPGDPGIVPLGNGKPFYNESSGIVVIHVSDWRWREHSAEIREVLSKVTLEDVQANGMRLPEGIWDQLEFIDTSIGAQVTVVQPRYLTGDWDTLYAQHQEDLVSANAAAATAMAEAEQNVARWDEVARVVKKLTGEDLFYFGSPNTPATTIRLTDMEALVVIARAALPKFTAPDVQGDV